MTTDRDSWSLGKLGELSPDAVVILQDGGYRYVNQRFCELFGYRREEATSTLTFLQLVQEADREAVLARYHQRLEGKPSPRTFRLDLRARDGRIVPCETSAKLITYQGKPADLVVIRDISERLQAEREHQEEQDLLAFLIEQSFVAFVVVQDGEVKLANQAAAAISGIDLQELLGTSAERYFSGIHPDDRPFVLEQLRRKLSGDQGATPRYELRMLERSGNVRWLEVFSRGMTFQGRAALIAILIDITHHKAAQERELALARAESLIALERERQRTAQAAFAELQRSHQTLQEAQSQLVQAEKYAAIGKLAAGVAHEINNPLSVLLGYVAFLEQQLRDCSPAQQESLTAFTKPLDRIRRAGERCKTIAEHLLTYSRFSPDTATDRALVVSTVLEESLTLLSQPMEAQGIELRQEIDEGLTVWGSPEQLQQVVMNVLLNAVQAMPEGGTLTLRGAPEEEGFALLEIGDTGPGIPTEQLSRIFDPFFTTKPFGQGTGLGLSITFGIVQRWGGEIAVRSTPGQGSTFYLRLPSRKPETAAAEPDHR